MKADIMLYLDWGGEAHRNQTELHQGVEFMQDAVLVMGGNHLRWSLVVPANEIIPCCEASLGVNVNYSLVDPSGKLYELVL